MKIWVHTLVKNEARFVWFSVMSVIDHVDKILLWDTESTDGTKEILKKIKELYPDKVDLKFLESVTLEEFTRVRQQMLDKTESDWFIVVDGDEIWWEESIQNVVETIAKEGNKLESIVVPNYMLAGDMYHYQEEKAGQYQLAGKKGHYNIRAINKKIPGLCSKGKHGVWGWADRKGRMIQDRDKSKIKFVDAPYLHTSFLPRAGEFDKEKDVPKRQKKLKYEIGHSFPVDFYYPEVLFRKKLLAVPSSWKTMDNKYFTRALVETPLRKIKRRVFPAKVGY